MGRYTLDDILGGLCIAAMIFGFSWVAAILQAVMQ
jgi:hypothetical protein